MKTVQILPPLAEGETYIGAIGDKSGEIYHLVLLPGDSEALNWVDAQAWAAEAGGDLPNKLEAAMLFAHVKDQFQQTAYWTNETFIDPDDPEDDAWAWCQLFDNGGQGTSHESHELRARAVRRLPI